MENRSQHPSEGGHRKHQTPNTKHQTQNVVGWKEYVDFPEWGIRRVKVKIDTGARTSALDVVSYELARARRAGPGGRAAAGPEPRHPEKLTGGHGAGAAHGRGQQLQRHARAAAPDRDTIRLGPVTQARAADASPTGPACASR